MSGLRAGALIGALVLLGVSAGGADSATPPRSAPPVPAAVLPPALQALDQKMESLKVDSERFTEVSRGLLDSADESNGKPVGHTRHISLNARVTGAASFSPSRAELSFDRGRRRSKQIVIGSISYTYVPRLERLDGGRPWVRSHGLASTFLPYQRDPGEVDAGGRGPYAGLLNLLATAAGEVVEGPSVSVDGQRAVEFQLSVHPYRLFRGLTQEDVAKIEANGFSELLTLYVSEAGVPVRVMEVQHAGTGVNSFSNSTITDILAVNVPLSIKEPSARRSIGEHRFETLLHEHGKELGVEERASHSAIKSKSA